MEALSYLYLITAQEENLNYPQLSLPDHLIFNSSIITKGSKGLLLALMIILGSNYGFKTAIAVENATNSTTTQTEQNILKIGSEGTEVQLLQTRLKALGFFNQDKTTTTFGPITQEAVIAFQKANNLTADGVAGATTQAKIEEKIRASNNSTSTDTSNNQTVNNQTVNNQTVNNQTVNNVSNSILKQNSRGEEVRILQQQLKQLNFFTAEATGYFGSITKEAVIAFQKANNLTADGVVGESTKAAISRSLQGNVSNSTNTQPSNVSNGDNALKRGMQGENVTMLQEQLKKINAYNGPVTGNFGSLTEDAVKKFQTQNGLTSDGVVDITTQAVINGKLQQVVTNTNTNVNQAAFSSQQIALFQQQLQGVNYYQGKIDGILGPGTIAALTKFQIDENLPITGIFDRATQTALNKNYSTVSHQQAVITPYVLSDNPSAQEIALMQRRLQIAGLYQGKIDGVMGKDTKEALEKARLAYGIASNY